MNKFAEYAAAAKAAAAAEALAGMSPAEQAAARATARSWDDQPAALRGNSAPWAIKDEEGRWDFSWNGVGSWPEWAAGEARLLKCLA